MPDGHIRRISMPTLRTPRSRRASKRPGARALDIPVQSLPEIVRLIQAGLPVSRVTKFEDATGFSREQIAHFVGIPVRTLARRRGDRRLRADESDRLWRAAALFDRAVDLFEGDAGAAARWLQTPQPGLDGAVPLEFASTEVGAREIENLIGRLEYGAIA
jgi:putative toxin-antitoxin system antitoxin component (TIGR02293 family)